MKIEDVKLVCPKCSCVTTVNDAVYDGTSTRTGWVFESDGSLGCPRCFYLLGESIYLKEIQP